MKVSNTAQLPDLSGPEALQARRLVIVEGLDGRSTNHNSVFR